MIRFIEVVNKTDFNPRLERTATPRFTLGEVWINEEYVVSVREAKGYQSLLAEGHLPSDLDAHHSFSSITTTNGRQSNTHIVVGSPQHVARQLGQAATQLLKG